jgi:hypothetical protein
MAKHKRAKPASETEASQPLTKQIRVDAELADMLGWIVRLKGGTIAQLVNRMMRSEVDAIYKTIEKSVVEIKKIEGEA